MLPRRACSSRVGLYVELFGSADDGLFRSGLVAAHFLSLRDLRLDHMRIGHVDDGEFRLVAGGVDLDGSYPEDAERAGLGSGGVLSQQTPGVCETAELTLPRRRRREWSPYSRSLMYQSSTFTTAAFSVAQQSLHKSTTCQIFVRIAHGSCRENVNAMLVELLWVPCRSNA